LIPSSSNNAVNIAFSPKSSTGNMIVLGEKGMFVIVKYGQEQEIMVNPNCNSNAFLSYIRKACGYESLPEQLDLASENGEVMDLCSKRQEYAKKALEQRGSYILVKVVDDDETVYLPLLDSAQSQKFSIANAQGRKGGKKLPNQRDETNVKKSNLGPNGASAVKAKR